MIAIDLQHKSDNFSPMGESKKETSDRHASGFMVRLPETYRVHINTLRKKNRRTITEEIKIALEEYFRKNQVWNDSDEQS